MVETISLFPFSASKKKKGKEKGTSSWSEGAPSPHSSTMSSRASRDRAASAVAFAAALAAALAAPAPTAAAAAAVTAVTAVASSSSSSLSSATSLSSALCSALPWVPLCSSSKQPSPAHLWFAPSRAPSPPLSARLLELLHSACLVATDSSPACSSSSSRPSSSSSSTLTSSFPSPLPQLLLQLLRPSSLAALLRHLLESAWELMRPGGPLHPVALRRASGHVALEAALAVVVVFLLSQRRSRPQRRRGGGANTGAEELTEAEVEALCDEWVPEPLVFSAADERAASEAHAAAVAAAATHALAAEAEAASAAAAAAAAAERAAAGGASSSSPSPPPQPIPPAAVVPAHLLVPPPPALDGVVVARRGPGPWVTVSSSGSGPSSSSNNENEGGNGSSSAATTTFSNKRALDFASLDFLGLAGDPAIARAAEAAIAKYGVGSCGPRGFYGTIDAHLDLENALARFCGTDEAILYSYDLATAPSVLPAFASARDVVVLDDAAPWALSNGAALSRARVRRFKHGCARSLEAVLRELAAEDARARRPPCRRFIVVEGVAASDGAVAPLPEIVRLKKKYRYRLVVDESLALGALGKTGRGACEHFGLLPAGVVAPKKEEKEGEKKKKKEEERRRKSRGAKNNDGAGGGDFDDFDDDFDESDSDEGVPDVDVVIATLGGALASVGGFCAASREIVDHQRLSGAGYCFSASLPPFLAVAASGALARLSAEGAAAAAASEAEKGKDKGKTMSRLERVRARALALRSALLESPAPGLYVCGCGEEEEEQGAEDGGGEENTAVGPAFSSSSSSAAAAAAAVSVASSVSPTIHLRLDPWAFPPGVAADPPTAEGLLRRVALDALSRDGVLCVACAAGAGPLEARALLAAAGGALLPPAPSLRLCVSASHSEADVRRAAGAVRAAARRVLSRLMLPAALKASSPSPTQQRQRQFAANGFAPPSPPPKMSPLSPLRNASPLRAKSAALAMDG